MGAASKAHVPARRARTSDGRLLEGAAPAGPAKPFAVDGLVFASIREASEFIGDSTPAGMSLAARLGKPYKGHAVAYAAGDEWVPKWKEPARGGGFDARGQ